MMTTANKTVALGHEMVPVARQRTVVAATGHEGRVFVHMTTRAVFEVGTEARRNGPHSVFYTVVGCNGDTNVDAMLRAGEWRHASASETRRHHEETAARLHAGMDVPAMVEDASGLVVAYTVSHVVVR